MGLINFDGNTNKQIAEQNRLIADLQRTSPNVRFKYPKAGAVNQNDQLGKLNPCSWKGVHFPITNLVTDITHDLVQHKYPNRDGGRVEEMGRNPVTVKCSCVFVNSIMKAPQEQWLEGDLYPTAYSKFLVEAYSGSTGEFNHPFLGKINCKLESAVSTMNGQFRGGEVVEATFIETFTDDSAIDVSSKNLNIIANTIFLSQSADKQIFALKPNPSLLGIKASDPSFSDLMQRIQAVFDTSTLIAQNGIGTITSIQYKCNGIIQAMDRLNNISHAQLRSDMFLLKSYAVELKTALLGGSRATSIFITKVDTTLSTLSSQLNTPIKDLMNLNPFLLATPVIAKNAKVRFYK